ncbi:MAG: hypothetical protein V4488_07235 [Pseudomonadota bacterium]
MFTNDDFEKIHWHDNAMHGFSILEGEDGCEGKLLLDIDFITEWLPPSNNMISFKIAPADLTFHDVSDLVISIDYAVATAAVQPMNIHEIHREAIVYPNGHSSFRWKIDIHWPPNGFISSESSGFTQVFRSEPTFSDAQYLSASKRKK